MKKPKKRAKLPAEMQGSVNRIVVRATDQVVRVGQETIADIAQCHYAYHEAIDRLGAAVERLEAGVKRVEEIEAASIRLLAILLPYMKK